MAREPDTPCARCGAPLWGGSTSLPAGRRTCRACRKALHLPTRTPGAGRLPKLCRQCGAEFTPERTRRTMCSTACAVAALHTLPAEVQVEYSSALNELRLLTPR